MSTEETPDSFVTVDFGKLDTFDKIYAFFGRAIVEQAADEHLMEIFEEILEKEARQQETEAEPP